MDSKIFLLPATQVEIGVSRKLDGTGQTIIDIRFDNPKSLMTLMTVTLMTGIRKNDRLLMG